MNLAANNYDFFARVGLIFQELGIPDDLPATKNLVIWPEPSTLVTAEVSANGRVFQLTPQASEVWRALKTAAANDGVALQMVSAFRSVEYQATIIRRKLERGLTLQQILTVNAPPGYSEHHSGCAIDIGSPDCPDLGEAFENTEAYRWLSSNAERFDLYLSFPRNNEYGYVYEPWHWRYHGDDKA
ncbi:M15 family metallopeptidase [Methylomonas sp. 11b]|uniref:M15 family metallopeptidase n=1 Tax=Methylomonas sp. 11b TaxID=1168169 RepID=UPI00047A695A|nr:M15 family metallopeptidase [Methylomonas sp. 11b]